MSKYGKYRQFDVQSRFLACEDKARLRAPSLKKKRLESPKVQFLHIIIFLLFSDALENLSKALFSGGFKFSVIFYFWLTYNKFRNYSMWRLNLLCHNRLETSKRLGQVNLEDDLIPNCLI